MSIELEAELKKIELKEEIKNLNKRINKLKEQSMNEYNKLVTRISRLPWTSYSKQIERLGLKTELAKYLYHILGLRDEGCAGTVEEAELRDGEWVIGLNLLINKDYISTCIDAMDYVYIEYTRCGKIDYLGDGFKEILNQYKSKKEFVDYIDIIDELEDKINVKEKQLKTLDKYIK